MFRSKEFVLGHKAKGLPQWLSSEESDCQAETQVGSLGREDPLEKEMATHSSILAREIPRTEEPGRLQSIGSQTVGGHQATKQHETMETTLGIDLSSKPLQTEFDFHWGLFL